MHPKKTQFIYIAFFIFLSASQACSFYQKKEQNYIDPRLWTDDLNNCQEYRKVKAEKIDSMRLTINGLREESVKELLGAPEQTLLYDRGQKFLEYRLNCKQDSINNYLRVRVNALGLVNEVLVLEK